MDHSPLIGVLHTLQRDVCREGYECELLSSKLFFR